MSAEWVFRELKPGNKDRQPTQGEFFATDAISSFAEALVRESIQNSLDAAVESSGNPVRVRFHLATGRHSLPAERAVRYFTSAWKHFKADGNGLDEVPSRDEPCPFLAVEDFQTTGLLGETKQWHNIPNEDNPYYFFFRAEGLSGKGEQDRGRWGIGKYVFPRSSRINSFLAVTVRSSDSRRLLMGQAILKSHSIEGRYFTPDADYGRRDAQLGGGDFVLPVEDETLIGQFCNDFSLQRENRAGLSIVVPWVNDEITRESLVQAVIKDYFFPILAGELVITVSTGDESLEVNRDTLEAASRMVNDDFAKRMLPMLQLSNWALEQTAETIVKLNAADPKRPVWDATLIPSDRLNELRQRFRSGERLAIEVPLTVREKGKTDRPTFFRAYLVNDSGDEGTPVFIRDGIIISDVRSRWVSGVRSLVVVEDKPLATLLGDAENPAHTQWQNDREHFRHKYFFSKSYIDFVSQSVSMFVRFLNESDQQPDRELLRDIFWIPKKPESDQAKEKSRPRKRNRGIVIIPDPKPEPRKRRFTIFKVAGGFTVTQGAPEAAVPQVLEIAVAYDRRRGSALKKYDPADFELDAKPIMVETDSVEVAERKLNRLSVRVLASPFRVSVRGFDENRDLYLDVKAKEAANDSEA